MPTLLQVYSLHQTNKLVTTTIEYAVKQFYLMNRKPFIMQMFGSVSAILDTDEEGTYGEAHKVNEWFFIWLVVLVGFELLTEQTFINSGSVELFIQSITEPRNPITRSTKYCRIGQRAETVEGNRFLLPRRRWNGHRSRLYYSMRYGRFLFSWKHSRVSDVDHFRGHSSLLYAADTIAHIHSMWK